MINIHNINVYLQSPSHYTYSTLLAHYMLSLNLAIDYLNYGYTLDDTDDVQPVVTKLRGMSSHQPGKGCSLS